MRQREAMRATRLLPISHPTAGLPCEVGGTVGQTRRTATPDTTGDGTRPWTTGGKEQRLLLTVRLPAPRRAYRGMLEEL